MDTTELVPCPMCKSADEVFACTMCNGTREVPRHMAEECIHPGCHKPPFGRGPLCREHGCVTCGEVILADYEEDRWCDECGTIGFRCYKCGKPALSIAEDMTMLTPSCGDRACEKIGLLYTPIWKGYVNQA